MTDPCPYLTDLGDRKEMMSDEVLSITLHNNGSEVNNFTGNSIYINNLYK